MPASSTKKHITLGKGLGALIPSRDQEGSKESSVSVRRGPAEQRVLHVPIANIVANPYQPRKKVDEGKQMNDLVASIKKYGILQPLVVMETKGGYTLIAGERRLRAATKAGLKKVPVLVRRASELEQLELALIENIQRQDLNPFERAEAYAKLVEEFGLTHEEAARRLGVSRSHFSNTLRYLRLAPEIQAALAQGRISEGQAKVLLELKDTLSQVKVFKKIERERLTVEDTQREVRNIRVRGHVRSVSPASSASSQYVRMARKLQDKLGTKVSIQKQGKGGKIVITYFHEEELEGIVTVMLGGRLD